MRCFYVVASVCRVTVVTTPSVYRQPAVLPRLPSSFP